MLDDERYVEALNACSLESYEGYFEDLNSRKQIQPGDLRLIEALPVQMKIASYALAILSCPLCTEEARAYAKGLLQRVM